MYTTLGSAIARSAGYAIALPPNSQPKNMIEYNTFADWYNILCVRFDRRYDPLLNVIYQKLNKTYYDRICLKVASEAAFVNACQKIFDEFDHFPTVSDFDEIVNGTKKLRAIKDWWQVCKLDFQESDDLSSLSLNAKVALKMLGGIDVLNVIDNPLSNDDLSNEFIRCWLECDRNSPETLEQMLAFADAIAIEEAVVDF